MLGRGRVAVPPVDAPMESIGVFASMTYYGYDRWGGQARLATFANAAFDHWRAAGSLPRSVRELRGALFYEARRWHHLGAAPDEESDRYMRALLGAIHQSTDGTVRADRPSILWWLRRRLRPAA